MNFIHDVFTSYILRYKYRPFLFLSMPYIWISNVKSNFLVTIFLNKAVPIVTISEDVFIPLYVPLRLHISNTTVFVRFSINRGVLCQCQSTRSGFPTAITCFRIRFRSCGSSLISTVTLTWSRLRWCLSLRLCWCSSCYTGSRAIFTTCNLGASVYLRRTRWAACFLWRALLSNSYYF